MKTRITAVCAAVIGACAAPLTAAAAPLDNIAFQWTHSHAGVATGFLSEIVSFDSLSQTLWVAGVKGVDVLDARSGASLGFIDTTALGSINSVAIHGGIAAFAIESTVRTQPGVVTLYDTRTRTLLAGTHTISVGALPDMLTFTPDGSKLLVANEATPSVYGTLTSQAGSFPRSYGAAAVDPAGSMSIIDMGTRSVSATATFAGAPESGSHIRKNTGMDYEPEYIAVNAAGTKAFVTLQEANAVGIVNLQTGTTEAVVGLGVKDFSAPGNRIDPLNNATNSLQSVNVKGLYMPDGIAAFQAGGQTFIAMANEGDFREDDGERVAAGSAGLGATAPLQNLRVSATDSSAGNLYAAGARSFSIRDENGNLVYDSGEILDREAMALGIYDDARSRDKGVEPEGIEVVQLGGRTFAFVGLERTTSSAVAIFDVSDPANTSFVRMLRTTGDISPEGLKAYTLDGGVYLAYSNEVSNTTTVYQLSPVPEPGSWALMMGGLLGLGALARRQRR
ncbi:Alkaline phosphatase [Rubrivivax sp. A210]|uniref:choice-of-anchor I family protein n=1 Tax=Rubrivivax sp. A210 TaxID=2772301 RepID=UPI00191907C4|nr:choice-of-anchor I family protein [Rubrivivax sp. A210]CAD5369729.1 Alkaline phosphatase [Rubrivivax sp. A210]